MAGVSNACRGSVVLAQIHPGIKAGDLIAVAVKHERLALEEFAQAAFAGLAPTGMVDRGIHIRIETVLARAGEIPSGGRLLLDELDLHDGLDAFETVLPRHHEANGCTVLVRQDLAVHAEAEERERVHGFVDAQAFHVRKRDAGVTRGGHLLGVVQALEGDEFGLRGGLDRLDQDVERKSDPGHYDGPRLHAAVPVDALFQRRHFHDGVQVENLGLGDRALHGDAPWRSLQSPGAFGRIVFAGAEFVEIVVAADVRERRGLLIGAKRALDGGQEAPAVQIGVFGCYFRVTNISRFFDQHMFNYRRRAVAGLFQVRVATLSRCRSSGWPGKAWWIRSTW